MKRFRYVVLLLAVLALLASLACRRHRYEPLPPMPIPSMVLTTEGVVYYVYDLRIPGTIQEFEVKKGGGTTWVPLDLISNVRFSGPTQEGTRPVRISLDQGERVEGLMLTDMLLEGTTDIGYWNMPLKKIDTIDWGTH
jgi:hypothetical protein